MFLCPIFVLSLLLCFFAFTSRLQYLLSSTFLLQFIRSPLCSSFVNTWFNPFGYPLVIFVLNADFCEDSNFFFLSIPLYGASFFELFISCLIVTNNKFYKCTDALHSVPELSLKCSV